MAHSTSDYSRNASHYIERYESVSFDQVHRGWSHLLPASPGLALDVGAGSGRDAAYLAELGWEVVAVEPEEALRRAAEERHPSKRIRWLGDSLPGLSEVHKLDFRFQVILLSAVWMHVPSSARERAFRKLAGLLAPGGIIVISLRHGPPDPARAMHPVNPEELQQLGRRFALDLVPLQETESSDELGRGEIAWTTHVFRLLDDGTGALPLLRHIIVNDAKSSTYKLALLRVLLRIADGARGMVLERDDEFVTLPMGLVGLYWIKAFKPLVLDASYQQQQSTAAGLGFVKDGFMALSDVSPHDFKISASFSTPHVGSLVDAIRDACNTIKNMPAHFTTYPGSDNPIFPVTGRPSLRGVHGWDQITLDRELLTRFGEFKIPVHLWDAMGRYACWIEPAILNEWCALMQSYETKAGTRRPLENYHAALQWLEPRRNTTEVRNLVERVQSQGRSVHCVWTGDKLDRSFFDIDHCFPFAYWPNNDLWNLLPSSPRANEQKSDRLPSADLVDKAQDRILNWWNDAYAGYDLLDRFRNEALSALPYSRELEPPPAEGGFDPESTFNQVFAGLEQQRIRLRVDQRLSEWGG